MERQCAGAGRSRGRNGWKSATADARVCRHGWERDALVVGRGRDDRGRNRNGGVNAARFVRFYDETVAGRGKCGGSGVASIPAGDNRKTMDACGRRNAGAGSKACN